MIHAPEEPMRIACFGQAGSYTYEAMQDYFKGQAITPVYASHFEDVIEAVMTREVRYGVVPIENSSTGGITEVYDLIHQFDCHVVGEKYVRVEHNLLGLPGAALEDIREVYSHPQGLDQCRGYLKRHGDWVLHPYFSTSQSAAKVQETGDPHLAAIANKTAAGLYGLEVLVPHINDNTTNYTRFFILAAQPEERETADKITLVLTVRHEPGALYHVLGYFFYNSMNMTHLESRPMKGRPFEYFFHIDVMGSLKDPVTYHVLHNLKDHCNYFKILGNYIADARRECT
ncbi:prephenate dehydratase [uncultured Megasphaera sp.]|uniref:prephenate dehydratase n=3 Tax=uncultured Megasphaera sp. TaxID=165188 RepID=UPI00259AB918|nr:prephenate dehydratase [uncultured Megasphaera sp.]